jgi:hypothetical protein
MILNFYLGKSRKLHLLVFTNYFTLEVPGPQLPLTYGGHSRRLDIQRMCWNKRCMLVYIPHSPTRPICTL